MSDDVSQNHETTETVQAVHVIRLRPTPEQAVYFARACGVARFVYNWGLAEWNRQYEAYRTDLAAWEQLADSEKECRPQPERPQLSGFALRKQLDSIKRQQFPWMLEVTSRAPQFALANLQSAFKRFFEKLKTGEIGKKRRKDGRLRGYPKFKSRFDAQKSFYASRGVKTKTDGKRIRLEMVNWVETYEALRFEGEIRRVVVKQIAGRWYASVLVETPLEKWPLPDPSAVCGVDVGLKTLATVSNHATTIKYDNPRPLTTAIEKLKRLQRQVDRKEKRSKNQQKARRKVARLQARIANIRKSSAHAVTTDIVENHAKIGVESLNVKGLQRGWNSRAVSDAAWGEFLRQIEYKARWHGREVVEVDQYFPSSKTCHCCGWIKKDLTLRDRNWTCESCGVEHDRDENAAINIRMVADGIKAG